jgi:ABC-type transport system involved in cytochrome c biogenesis permease component
VRNVGLLLRKDLRLLLRTPLFLALLVAYPIVVSGIVATALSGDDRRPAVAFVNLEGSGRTLAVGDERLGVDDYVARLAERVRLRELDPGAAERALDAGRVSAVLTLPEGFIADLQSGVRQPVLHLRTSGRSPIEAEAIQRRLEAAVFRLNQRLAEGYIAQVVRLVDLVVEGGEIAFLGRSVEALGLVRSRDLVVEVQRALSGAGNRAAAARLDPLVAFIDATRANLDLARPAATAIGSPIALDVTEGPEGSEPLSAFGVAGALLMSLGLAGVLLGAAVLSSEREDNALVRLRRGLVRPAALVGEKVAFAGGVCVALGLVLLAAVALLTSLAVDRWGLWLAALVVSGLAFGALGVLLGALARETRTALLAGLMLGLPLIALALLPDGRAAGAVAEATPFGPAFDAYRELLLDPEVSGRLALDVLHVGLVGAALAALAGLAVARRPA